MEDLEKVYDSIKKDRLKKVVESLPEITCSKLMECIEMLETRLKNGSRADLSRTEHRARETYIYRLLGEARARLRQLSSEIIN